MVLGAKHDEWGKHGPHLHERIAGSTYPIKNDVQFARNDPGEFEFLL